MQPMTRRTSAVVFACALCFVAADQEAHAQACTEHTFLGNGPNEQQPGWHHEANGLTHDEAYWYITQNFDSSFGDNPQLWRIPVDRDLSGNVDCSTEGVSCSSAAVNTPLFGRGYNHYGDPDFYELEGEGYVVVPAEGGDLGPAAAFFRADEALEFLALAPVRQHFLSWLAVDQAGILVSSEGRTVGELTRYEVAWDGVRSETPVLSLQELPPVLLRDDTGAPLQINSIQGGEFSDDGQLLYLSAGFLAGRCADPDCVLDCPDEDSSWGVHVFRTRPGTDAECGAAGRNCVIARRIERSMDRAGGFAFEFDPTFSACEEPEGLTFWDLDADGRAPGLGGQLHVVLLDNEVTGGDEVYVKHYRMSLTDFVPPAIACPEDASAECSAQGGVPASDQQLASFFAGVSAQDNCDDDAMVSHDAPALFGLGSTAVTFSAADDFGNTSQCLAIVTVVDTVPPRIQCPSPLTVECTGQGGISADDPQLHAFFSGVSATDVCSPMLAISNNAPAVLPLGQTVVSFTTTDGSGNGAGCTSTINVADTIAPMITATVSPQVLWPPDHRLVRIRAQVNVADRCDPSASYQLISITSNEPDNGLGDGDTPGDIQGAQLGTADARFALRAERSGPGNGRVYTIVYRTSDDSWNPREATVSVAVPLGQ